MNTPCDMLALELESARAELAELYEKLDKMPSGVPLYCGRSTHLDDCGVVSIHTEMPTIGENGFWTSRGQAAYMTPEDFRRSHGFVLQPGELCRGVVHFEKMAVEPE